MDKAKREAILAFYNSFSDELHTELCGSLADVRYLLNTVVKFVEFGKLEFHDHTNFGFRETVHSLRNLQPQLGERLTERLDWLSADSGDQMQIAKILLALIYAIRLERSAALISYVRQLPDKHNRTVAAMIGHLDRDEHNENEEDVLASLLAVDERRRRSSSGTPQKASGGGSFMASPLYDCSNNNSLLMAGGRLPGIDETPQRAVLYSDVFGDADSTTRSTIDSPIAYVVRSPRGKHIERVRQLTRELENTKQTLRTLERESDEFKLNVENELREKTTELGRLRRRLELANAKAKQAESLQRQLADERSTVVHQASRIELLESELNRLAEVRSRLMLDCETGCQRIELLEDRIRLLDDSNDKLRRELSDMREIVDFTNKKLAAAECEVDAYSVKYTMMREQYENELAVKDLLVHEAHSQKADTLQQQLETAELVNEQYYAEIGQLREALAAARRVDEEADKNKQAEFEQLRERLSAADMAAASANARNAELSSQLEEALSTNSQLQEQLDCTDVMLRLRDVFAYSPRRSDVHAAPTTDEELDMRFFTPRSAFGGDDASVHADELMAAVDLWQEQEDELFSQTSTDGTDETLTVEQSPVHSRHIADSFRFVRESDGCEFHSLCTQTDGIAETIGVPLQRSRKSSFRRMVRFVRDRVRHSRLYDDIGRLSDVGNLNTFLRPSRDGMTSCSHSTSTLSAPAIEVYKPAKTTTPVPRIIDFDRETAAAECENWKAEHVTVTDLHPPPLDKIVEESSPLVVETPKESKKVNRRRSFLPTFSK